MAVDQMYRDALTEIDHLKHDIDHLQRANTALATELEELREDALRYQFLRSLLDKDADFIDPLFPDHAPETLEEFDAHVDSAREKARQLGWR